MLDEMKLRRRQRRSARPARDQKKRNVWVTYGSYARTLERRRACETPCRHAAIYQAPPPMCDCRGCRAFLAAKKSFITNKKLVIVVRCVTTTTKYKNTAKSVHLSTESERI